MLIKTTLFHSSLLSICIAFSQGCGGDDTASQEGTREISQWGQTVNIVELISSIDGDTSKAYLYNQTHTMKELEEICGGKFSLLTTGTLDAVWSGGLDQLKANQLAQQMGGDLGESTVADLAAVWGGDLNQETDIEALAQALGADPVNASSEDLEGDVTLSDLASVWGGDVDRPKMSEMSAVWGGDLNTIKLDSFAVSTQGSLGDTNIADLHNVWGGDVD